MLEKIKTHVQKHKAVYTCGAVALATAGITTLVMRDRYEALVTDGAYGLKTADTSVTMRSLSFLSSQNNIVSVITRNGRGHPGYLVHCLDSDEYFSSQREAALACDVSETLLSKHLNGKLPNVDGRIFNRINVKG